MDIIMRLIRETKEATIAAKQKKQLGGSIPTGDNFREDRVDKLHDACLYFISPHRYAKPAMAAALM